MNESETIIISEKTTDSDKTLITSRKALLDVSGLHVSLPDGRMLLKDIRLYVAPGEVVAILGPSGSGKSTLARAIFEPESLKREGMKVIPGLKKMPSGALVPQRGAPFDHLDVKGNVELVLGWHGKPRKNSEKLLKVAGFNENEIKKGSLTGTLSGGQTQRLAIARILAAGKSLLFLDEPSAGLDSKSVYELSRSLREQVNNNNCGIVIVTHDTQLAAEAADRCLILDPFTGSLNPISFRRGDRAGLEKILRDELASLEPAASLKTRRFPNLNVRLGIRRFWENTLGPLTLPLLALEKCRDLRFHRLYYLLRIAFKIVVQALIRPALFYAVVSMLLGFTVLYVLVKAAPAGLSSARLLDLVGGSYVLALAPPLSALLFVATSGSAISAWLGSLSLSKQITALEALGIPSRTYLWLPVFISSALCYLCVALIFAAGLIAGGYLLHHLEGTAGPGTLSLLTGDLLDPIPERASLRARSFWLAAIYGPGIASDLVFRGTIPKASSDEVTKGMTGSVVACTLWVVALELVAALILFAGSGTHTLINA